MRRVRILLASTVVALASTAWGQSEGKPAESVAPAPPAPGPAAPSATTLVMPPCAETTLLPQASRDCLPSAPVSRWLRVARIGVEVVLGTGLGAIGELSGGYVGFNVDVLSGHEAGPGLAIGTLLGATLGVAPGVWLGGRTLGGDGSWGWSLIGGALGSGLGAAVLAIKNSTATLIIALALPVLGSITGYELSSNPKRAPESSGGLTVMPSIGLNSIGLVGAF